MAGIRAHRTALQGAKNRRASAAFEFALVLPVWAAMVLGLCELGRAVTVKEVLVVAARHGCRSGVRPTADSAAVLAAVQEILADNRIPGAQATVTILVNDQAANVATAKPLDKITVQVSIPYAAVSWLNTYFFVSRQMVEIETVVMLRQG